MKEKPRTPIETLSERAALLYAFGLNFCTARDIPLSWLRLYSGATLHTDVELFVDGFFSVPKPSFAEYSKRRYHIRLISVALRNQLNITWMTPRVWLEAPSVDDLRGFFPAWGPKRISGRKDITLSAVAPLPRLLLGLFTFERDWAPGSFRIYPAPLPSVSYAESFL